MSGKRLERQLVAPRSGPLAGVGADLEDVVGSRLKSVDNDGRLCGVGRPVVGRAAAVVVHEFIEHDLAVAMLSGRRVPLQSNARRAHPHSGEIERRAGRY